MIAGIVIAAAMGVGSPDRHNSSLTSGSAGTSLAEGGSPADTANVVMPDPATTPVPDSAPDIPTTGAPIESAAPSRPASTRLETYSAPGGVTVSGPNGYVRDDSAGVPHVRDYREPSSPSRVAGIFFRIGVGNVDSNGSFAAEAEQSARFLETSPELRATILRGPSGVDFLGTQAYDIEFRYYNSTLGFERHAIERIWRSGGNTLIIEASGRQDEWSRTQQLFRMLTSSA